nr:uncharacterized protein LOC127310414 [Lolium perenne]
MSSPSGKAAAAPRHRSLLEDVVEASWGEADVYLEAGHCDALLVLAAGQGMGLQGAMYDVVDATKSAAMANLKARAAEAAANVAKVEEAGKVPQLESDLRAARAQCAESEEAGRSAAGKLKLAEQELTRLRLLEQNHLAELNSLRTAEKEKVDDLSRRLTEVEKQRLVLQEEVTAKSTELTATAKRWTDEFSALDRGLAAAFPETQDAALAAVGVARDSRRRETGEGSSEYFSMEDHMASMAARIEPITKLGWELRKAAEELVPMLWPEEAVPQDISGLISSMERAPDRFLDWKE